MNILYDMDGPDTFESKLGSRFDEHLDNVAKLTKRVHLWPGWGEINWRSIEKIVSGLEHRGIDTWWVVRPLEFSNVGELPIADWNLSKNRDAIIRQVRNLGSRGVVIDTRSHATGVANLNNRQWQNWPTWRLVAAGIEKLLHDLAAFTPATAWVSPVPTEAFLTVKDNPKHYGLDGAQHICNSLNHNYWDHDVTWGLYHVRPPIGVETISGGMRWTADDDTIERWLRRCRLHAQVNCKTIKYEAHELLTVPGGVEVIRNNLARMERHGFTNVVLYSTNTFAWNTEWIKEMGK